MGASTSAPRKVTFQSDEDSGRIKVSSNVARRLLKAGEEEVCPVPPRPQPTEPESVQVTQMRPAGGGGDGGGFFSSRIRSAPCGPSSRSIVVQRPGYCPPAPRPGGSEMCFSSDEDGKASGDYIMDETLPAKRSIFQRVKGFFSRKKSCPSLDDMRNESCEGWVDASEERRKIDLSQEAPLIMKDLEDPGDKRTAKMLSDMVEPKSARPVTREVVAETCDGHTLVALLRPKDECPDRRPFQSAVVAGMTSATLVFSQMVKRSDREFSQVAPTAMMSAVGAGLASAGLTYAGTDAMLKVVDKKQIEADTNVCPPCEPPPSSPCPCEQPMKILPPCQEEPAIPPPPPPKPEPVCVEPPESAAQPGKPCDGSCGCKECGDYPAQLSMKVYPSPPPPCEPNPAPCKLPEVEPCPPFEVCPPLEVCPPREACPPVEPPPKPCPQPKPCPPCPQPQPCAKSKPDSLPSRPCPPPPEPVQPCEPCPQVQEPLTICRSNFDNESMDRLKPSDVPSCQAPCNLTLDKFAGKSCGDYQGSAAASAARKSGKSGVLGDIDEQSRKSGWLKSIALPNALFQDAKKVKPSKDDLQDLHNFYKARLSNMEELNKCLVYDTVETFKATVAEVETKFMESRLVPVCQNCESKVLDCYRKNGCQSLVCRDVVNDFLRCVDKERMYKSRQKCAA